MYTSDLVTYQGYSRYRHSTVHMEVKESATYSMPLFHAETSAWLNHDLIGGYY